MRAALTVLSCALFLLGIYLGLTGEPLAGVALGALGVLTLVTAFGLRPLFTALQQRKK